MFPWMFPSWWSIKGPTSRDIATITRLFSPQFEFNFQGDEKIETQVLADVASYGRQLGILSDALMEVVDGGGGEAVAKFKKLVKDIDEVKEQHKHRLEQRIREQLDDLKERDDALLQRVIEDYRKR